MATGTNTRKGKEWWDKFCALPRFWFARGENSVECVPDKYGKWLEWNQVSELVDEMQEKINQLESEVAALQVHSN